MGPLCKTGDSPYNGLSSGRHPGPVRAGRKGPGVPSAGDGPYHSLVNAILTVLKAIPRGRMATYGQVAGLAGNPRAARQVARVLHTLSRKQNLPWQRVVNRNGCISLPMDGDGALQAALLRKEGVKVGIGGKVDLAAHGWEPGRIRRSTIEPPGKRPVGKTG